jgi:integrase
VNSESFFGGGKATTRTLVKAAARTLTAVFKLAKVERAHPHRFRHTLASDLLGKGASIQDVVWRQLEFPADDN